MPEARNLRKNEPTHPMRSLRAGFQFRQYIRIDFVLRANEASKVERVIVWRLRGHIERMLKSR